jgi:alpha-glucosidase
VYPFPGHSSFSYIYSDDGDGFGPHRIDNFYVNYEENTLLITWESEGNYPFPYSRINLIIHFLKLLNASADGMMIPTHANMVSTPVFHNLILNFE